MSSDSAVAEAKTPPREAAPVRPALWTRAYWLLLATVFLGYVGQQLILPILPLYVTSLGGTPVTAGLVLASLSVTSFPMRPLIGLLSDTWSARSTLMLGKMVLAATSLGFFVPVVGVMAGVMAIRGCGWAALNTGGYTVLARVAPRERRGEASGYYNLATSFPIACAPALALWMIATPSLGFGSAFLLAAVCSALGVVVTWGMRFLGPELDARSAGVEGLSLGKTLAGFIDRRVFLATALLLCMTVTQVSTSSFLPLYARAAGIGNIGVYFIVTGAIGILSQLLGGRFLDRGNRGWWLVAGFCLMIASMLVLSTAATLELILVAGLLNTLGNALLNTMLLVVAMEMADPNRPGAAMATYSLAYQLGNAIGAPVFGFVIEVAGYSAMYLGSAAALAVGLVATLQQWPKLAGRLGVPAAAPAGRGNRQI